MGSLLIGGISFIYKGSVDCMYFKIKMHSFLSISQFRNSKFIPLSNETIGISLVGQGLYFFGVDRHCLCCSAFRVNIASIPKEAPSSVQSSKLRYITSLEIWTVYTHSQDGTTNVPELCLSETFECWTKRSMVHVLQNNSAVVP